MKLTTQISLGFLIAISVDVVTTAVNVALDVRVKTNLEFLNRSETIVRNSAEIHKQMVEMQSAFRGYLLSGDDALLGPYYDGERHLPALISEEQALVLNPGQEVTLDSIVWLHQRWMEFSHNLIAAKELETANPKAYRSLFNAQFQHGIENVHNRGIAHLFQQFDDAEYVERNERRRALTSSIVSTDDYSLASCVLLVIIGAGIGIFLIRRISTRIRTQVNLAEGIARGDFGKVEDDKRDELSSLSVSLNHMSERLSRNIGELEKKNAELNQFAYVVSHDLKAPVRGISNVVQWIEEDLAGEIGPVMRKYLDFIPGRIARVQSLIDGLLEYARAGRDIMPAEEVDVEGMVRELADLIGTDGATVVTENLPVLHTERLPLQQVFSNLLSNAVKYAGRDANIRVACKEHENDHEFSVSDNGPGISPEYHEKVFGLFQTLRERSDTESTGIGLAIVKKIVEERGGNIKLVSSAGNGANFVFTWPKKKI
ncbi:MAG TPA: ATP-binding protein [Puia sp.]|nr:ATP-binding protein [Puia sp.]